MAGTLAGMVAAVRPVQGAGLFARAAAAGCSLNGWSNVSLVSHHVIRAAETETI